MAVFYNAELVSNNDLSRLERDIKIAGAYYYHRSVQKGNVMNLLHVWERRSGWRGLLA